MKPMIILKWMAGFVALLFGAIGIFLPVWPTTPFVLLALGCFSSVPKVQQKILQIKFFSDYYESYKHGVGLRRKNVCGSLVFLWSMLILSGVLVENLAVRILLAVVGAAVTAHILYLSKDRPKKTANMEGEQNGFR
ncbi:YbaN family protein [Christensenellaceae bacterium OttesenSCG-928-L17]|nr:YbaN family protein [Christensenellaceae bacterium OttesenSCG-928-L17]